MTRLQCVCAPPSPLRRRREWLTCSRKLLTKSLLFFSLPWRFRSPWLPRKHLSNPIFDAQTIQTELEKHFGFQVEPVFDPSRRELYDVLDKLHDRKWGPDDQLFIFIAGLAGHGAYDAKDETGRQIGLATGIRLRDRRVRIETRMVCSNMEPLFKAAHRGA